MNISEKRSVPSKLISPRYGAKPLIERTDGEKIRIAKSYLEKHGYVVFTKLMTRQEVAEYLKCSEQHIKNMANSGVFPHPYDIGSNRTHIDNSTHKRYRWESKAVNDWLESTKCES